MPPPGRLDCRIRGSASAAIERRWKLNQPANLQENLGLEGVISKHFLVQNDSFKVRTALSWFTVKDPCLLPSVDFDM